MRDPENVINSVLKGTRNFEELAEKNGVDSFHIELIAKRLRELSPEGKTAAEKPFSFTTDDGYTVSDIRFERTEKGNIHLLATINGQEAKFVFTPRKEAYKDILASGFNRMSEDKKRDLVEQYLLGRFRRR